MHELGDKAEGGRPPKNEPWIELSGGGRPADQGDWDGAPDPGRMELCALRSASAGGPSDAEAQMQTQRRRRRDGA